MGRFFDAIDKYKFGLIAALATYVIVFMYLQMAHYTEYIPIEPFSDGPAIEIPEDEIELLSENILVPDNFNADVKNITRDVNDKRERSYQDYETSNMTAAEIEEHYKQLEQEMYDEAGGDKTRAEIRKEMEARKKAAAEAQDNNEPKHVANNGSDKVYKGAVMVDWDLKGRTPHLNNEWYVRNPGYLCPGAGVVVVDIKVNSNGNVISAEYNPARSRAASQCMIDDAVKYAKISRFNYDSSKSQPGWIQYTFVAQ